MTGAEDFPKLDIKAVLVALGADESTLPADGPGWRKMRCPFHGTDRTPSAGVNYKLNRFKCHTCDYGGDGIDLICRARGVTPGDAIKWARDTVGLQDEGLRPTAPRRPERYRPSFGDQDD